MMTAVTHPSGRCAVQPTRDSCVIDGNIDVIDRRTGRNQFAHIFNWLIVFIEVRGRVFTQIIISQDDPEGGF